LSDTGYYWYEITTLFESASNDASNKIWVWGDSEQAWVVEQPVTPSWSDSAGWNANDGDSDPGDTVSNQAYFPAQANSWYLAWFWADASVGERDDGLFFSAGLANMDVSIPFMVFEQ
jgi:hypothetical protein